MHAAGDAVRAGWSAGKTQADGPHRELVNAQGQQGSGSRRRSIIWERKAIDQAATYRQPGDAGEREGASHEIPKPHPKVCPRRKRAAQGRGAALFPPDEGTQAPLVARERVRGIYRPRQLAREHVRPDDGQRRSLPRQE